MIYSSPVSDILEIYGVHPSAIVGLLNSDTPLTHKSNLLGLDHLDSFLRDTFFAGKMTYTPRIGLRSYILEGIT